MPFRTLAATIIFVTSLRSMMGMGKSPWILGFVRSTSQSGNLRGCLQHYQHSLPMASAHRLGVEASGDIPVRREGVVARKEMAAASNGWRIFAAASSGYPDRISREAHSAGSNFNISSATFSASVKSFAFRAASSLCVKALALAWLPVFRAQAGNSRWIRWIFAGSRSK